MFTLANRYTFAPNPKMCHLSAFVGHHADGGCRISWHLKAHSESSLIRSHLQHDKREAALESVAFGIDCNGLSFDVPDWKELGARSFEIDPACISGGLMVFQWEGIS